MKILKIKLIAFGPFTRKVLDLAEGQEGLHIIYGPNEAGKSSALRALRQMFYGIPERSMDDFMHPYSKIRIGAVLRRSDGSILEFVRRKGRVNTLRAPDDTTVIDEALMRTFLGGVDRDLFATMFGIDHSDLVRGGEEIIRGGGEIGQVLFAAGSGISDLRKIQEKLQVEADALFKISAQKPKINEAIALLKQNEKALREAQLPGQLWIYHDTALREALDCKKLLEQNLAQQLRERHRLERIREAFPIIGKRKDWVEKGKTCADAILLPADFGERRRDALTNLRIAENDKAQARKNLDEIHQALKELEVPESLLAHADMIESIYQDLGSHRKAMKDRFRLLTQQRSLESDVMAILRDLRSDVTIDQAEQFRLSKAESVRIHELCTAHERLLTRSESSRDEIAKLSVRMDRMKKQLKGFETTGDTFRLKNAVERIQQQGDLEGNYQTECRNIDQAEQTAILTLEKQTLWRGNLEMLEKLSIPPSETIDKFEKCFGETESTLSRHREEIGELERTILQLDGQIEKLKLEQEVPTEGDLNQARSVRETGWQLIRRALNGKHPRGESEEDFVSGFPASKDLTEAYEISVRKADEIADRLRREADRVAKKATLLADRETRKNQYMRLKNRLSEIQAELSKIAAQWAVVWEAITVSPESPREMRTWALKMAALAEQASTIRERKAKLENLKACIEICKQELNERLEEIGASSIPTDETLSQLLEKSRQIAERMDKIRAEREQIFREIGQREGELREAISRADQTDRELAHWQSKWTEAIHPLGLKADASPAQANAVLEDLKNLFEKLGEAKDRRRRIESIDRDAKKFKKNVLRLVDLTTPDLAEIPIEEATAALNGRLVSARSAKTQQQSLEKQRLQQEERLQHAENRIADLRSQLLMMCQEAGCKSYEELPAAEELSALRVHIQTQLEKLEDQLRRLSAGATIDEFVRDAQTVDPDGIDVRIERLTENIDELSRERSRLDQKIGSERTELSKMNGSARAAELAEESQNLLASIETNAQQYARFRLAFNILNQAIERYREKNQGPILKRSNDLFSRMTFGSFEGLRLEYNEKGEAVLVGVRSGGKEIVGVEGMSDGSADQLYLAIRLASLEAYLEKNEALPFIVDDILIKFDDHRATVTLQALAKLSEKTQIIFFTHHHHLVELAKSNLDPDLFFVHFLHSQD
jgi:uncharacterized protein YhaN